MRQGLILQHQRRWSFLYIYPSNLKGRAKLWLWHLPALAVLGAGGLLSLLALSGGMGTVPLAVTALYGFLSIRVEDTSVLDFLRCATTLCLT